MAGVLSVVIVSLLPSSAPAPEQATRWVVDVGEAVLSLRPELESRHGVRAVAAGAAAVANEDLLSGARSVAFTIESSDFLATAAKEDDLQVEGSIRLDSGVTLRGPQGQASVHPLTIVIDGGPGSLSVSLGGLPEELAFDAPGAHVEIDHVGGTLFVSADDVALTPRWAEELGAPGLAGQAIGSFVVRVALMPIDGRHPATQPSWDDSGTVAGEIGPDIILADLTGTANYGSENGVSAFSVGTNSCNQGDQQALWESWSNQHPVIGQNIFRLKSDRFEQIGQSWLKHGYFALQDNFCGLGCQPSGTASRLGVGCSDLYTAGLNGNWGRLGPKWEIDAHTGFFLGNSTRSCSGCTDTERRLQVHNDDLDPALNDGALYFVEGQYVSPDDAQWGNGNNNASYRRMLVSGPNASQPVYRIALTDSTRRRQPGIRAWQDRDPEVVETDVQVPGEGLFILAGKAIDQGDGTWRYEYAVQNLNSDRSGGSFTVPLPDGAVVLNPGFHDVDYHSGEPFDGTDWEPVITEEAITWSTTPYAQDLNANALRWGTLYNFRFESNAAPGEVTVRLGLFKPGDPAEVSAQTIGPAVGLSDCNENGIPDFCDISCAPIGCDEFPCGTSEDCQPNGIPDDCEPDCDGDGVPDDCDVPEDCDGDGIEDCDDYCRCTSAEGACVCPPTGCCLYPVGIELCGIPPEDCLLQGGTPDCQGSPCAGGCMLDEIDGDFDRDGDRDIEDTGAFSACFSGPTDMPGFTEPSMECRARFDFDNDGAVELLDYKTLQSLQTGP